MNEKSKESEIKEIKRVQEKSKNPSLEGIIKKPKLKSISNRKHKKNSDKFGDLILGTTCVVGVYLLINQILIQRRINQIETFVGTSYSGIQNFKDRVKELEVLPKEIEDMKKDIETLSNRTNLVVWAHNTSYETMNKKLNAWDKSLEEKRNKKKILNYILPWRWF